MQSLYQKLLSELVSIAILIIKGEIFSPSKQEESSHWKIKNKVLSSFITK